MKITIVVDVQNDFINGALGTPEAQAALPNIFARKKLADENGDCGVPLRRASREKGCVQYPFIYFYKKICYNIYVKNKER